MNQVQINFILRAFDPSYQITVDQGNRIIELTNSSVIEEIFAPGKQINKEDLFDHNLYDLLSENPKNKAKFLNMLKIAIDFEDSVLLAMSSNSYISKRLAIPCIYLLLLVSSVDKFTKLRVIKIYNLIKLSRQLHELFISAMIPSASTLTNSIRGQLKQKSVYFAFESLKYFAGFIPKHQITTTNSHYLSELVYSFHSSKRLDKPNKLYHQRLLKECGYVETDKNRYYRELSQDTIQEIMSRPIIPFNQLSENLIITV